MNIKNWKYRLKQAAKWVRRTLFWKVKAVLRYELLVGIAAGYYIGEKLCYLFLV